MYPGHSSCAAACCNFSGASHGSLELVVLCFTPSLTRSAAVMVHRSYDQMHMHDIIHTHTHTHDSLGNLWPVGISVWRKDALVYWHMDSHNCASTPSLSFSIYSNSYSAQSLFFIGLHTVLFPSSMSFLSLHYSSVLTDVGVRTFYWRFMTNPTMYSLKLLQMLLIKYIYSIT